MKKRILGVIKLLSFILLLYICLFIIWNVTKAKESYIDREDFNNQEEEFDVLFLGSSHVKWGISPMELWRDYGIVSYNLGTGGETIPVSYWSMRLALKQTNPKLIVIDSYMVSSNKKYDTEKTHKSLDSFPVSFAKFQAVYDIFETENLIDYMMNYIFNFSIYHSRWDELEKADFKKDINYQKGANLQQGVTAHDINTDFETVSIYNDKETIGMEYLRKIIEYCQKKKIDVLVAMMPYPANNTEIGQSKYIKQICDEYNVNYVNFLKDKEIVNDSTDYRDQHGHLNASGARKVTKYLGKYIMENYNIPDQRKNEAYSFWNKDLNEYIDYKIQRLKANNKDLQKYLMLLYDDDFKFDIKIKSTVKIEEGSTLSELLKNLNNDYEIDDTAFKNAKDKNIKITVYDKRDNKKIDEVYFKYE